MGIGIQELYSTLKIRYSDRLKRGGFSPWWPGNQEEIIISAILTQNTNWGNVEKALENLRKAGCLSLEKIRNCQKGRLEKLIKPAGFFRQKAGYLKNISRFIMPYVEKGEIPERNDLLKVRGVGKETADSILLYGFHAPEFVVDAYTKRLAKRLLGFEGNYEKVKEFFASRIEKNWKMYAEFHGLIVEFSKNICKKKPECEKCFFREKCEKFRGTN